MFEVLLGFLCLAALVGAVAGIVAFGFWMGRRTRSGPSARGRVPGSVDYGRDGLLDLLLEIRSAPDSTAALDAAIDELRVGRDDSLEAAPDQRKEPTEPGQQAGETTAERKPTPTTAGLQVGEAVDSSGTADAPVALNALSGFRPADVAKSTRRHISIDNITLLLYLGAVLVIIGAGVFIGGSWNVLGGTAKALVVLIFALGFLLSGEFFVRATTRLQEAGRTFRNVGALLLPFSALAYARFVLDGGDSRYWAAVGAVAVLFYALWRRVSGQGRLAVYLTLWGAGVLIASLPGALGLGDEWAGLALQLMASVLFFLTYRAQPNGRRLLRRLLRADNDLLAESMFIAGVVVALISLVRIDWDVNGFDVILPLLLLTANAIALALWLDASLLVVPATFALALGLSGVGDLVAPDEQYVQPLAMATTSLLALVGALVIGARMRWGRPMLLTTALFWAFAGRLQLNTLLRPDWVGPVLVIYYLALTGVLAVLLRNGLFYLFAFIVLHVGILDLLGQFSSANPTLLAPTVAWTLLALLWVLLERNRRWPPANLALRGAFLVDALLALGFLVIPVIAPWARPGSPGPVPGWAGVGLALLLLVGWSLMTVSTRSGLAFYGLFVTAVSIIYLVVWSLGADSAALYITSMAFSLATAAAANRAPTYLRRSMDLSALVAIPMIPLVAFIWPTAPSLGAVGMLDATIVAQSLLLVAVLFYIWKGLLGSEPVAILSMLLSMGWVMWLVVDYLGLELAPVPVFFLALLFHLIARRAHRDTQDVYRWGGYVIAFVAPLATVLAAILDAQSSSLWTGGKDIPARAVLLASSALFVANGLLRNQPLLAVVGGFLGFGFYAWWLVDREASLQLYSAPLALLLLSYGRLMPGARRGWEAAAVLTLLLPAAGQMIGEDSLLYTLLPALWGLLLLVYGMVRGRRIPLVGGVVGILTPAIYQLVKVVAELPPAIVITVAGLLFMAVAVLLTLKREWLMHRFARFLDKDDSSSDTFST